MNQQLASASLISRFTRLAAVVLGITLLAPSTVRADAPNVVDVDVSYGSRVGFPREIFVFTRISSTYGLAMVGDCEVFVNGVRRKVEPVVTNDEVYIELNLGVVAGNIAACATFGGVADFGDSNTGSVQGSDCRAIYLPPRSEPGTNLQPPTASQLDRLDRLSRTRR